eukprot:CAMPEP_0172465378 /NCGR_PEP_ID=MMETSP1065-20121228/53328_1 /TAXON_ID=265537 /ORGANISM="Amphiprora paludosa, Strain CCMP125" /LENGTH=1924 /DNA_ID=CAMNT_0013221897 /DNA_START=90 /DNA_END=5865 /DNA_ORIENTATION=+
MACLDAAYCIYRARNPIGTFLEIALPVGFVAILLGIKAAVEGDDLTSDLIPPFIPGNENAFRPFSYQDYLTSARAEKVCVEQFNLNEDPIGLGISGISLQGTNWMVPMVKCDSRKCDEPGQDASKFCEYSMVAVTGSDASALERAKDFQSWVKSRYPELESDMPFDFDAVQVFDSSTEINSYVRSGNYGKTGYPKIMMGIVWESGDDMNFDYRLRLNQTNFNNPKDEARPGARTTPDTAIWTESFSKSDSDTCVEDDGAPSLGFYDSSCTGLYMYNGALTIQRLVGDYILAKTGAADAGFEVAEGGVQYVQFPTTAYEEQGFYSDISEYGPILVCLGLLYPAASIIGFLTREKEYRQKELMKMMSITEAEIGWSWFTSFFAFHFINVILCTVLTNILYEETEVQYLFFYWLFTFWAVINFCSTIATFTSRSTVAVLVGLLLFFCGVFLPTAYDYTDGESGLTALISLHPIAAFGFGMQEIGDLEDKGVGVTADTVDTSDHPSGYTFQNALNSLVASAIFWGIVGWYLARVLRPDYGQALPFYFPFTSSYWCPSTGRSGSGASSDIEYDADVPVEPVSDNLKRQSEEGKCIDVRNLQKNFGDKVAVNDLSLSMYSGQITALLGHNGAGKTTTIGMLTGALAPSSGTAIVAGKDVRTQLDEIREDIGICLQHDCLFPLLTVKEHIQFFSQVKGLYDSKSRSEADELVDQAIQDVALMEKRDTQSRNLSGGMKRKLSVAIAFCGGSKVVLLDEPTSGMDPFSRRFTWNVIRQYRQDRCIILTTHFMDEADILGDRIAIMADGELRCCGSSMFLKKTYGVGYQLTIERNHANEGEGKGELQEIVQSNVEEAVLLSDVGTELSYQLPMGAAPKFTPMFEGLDKEVDAGVVSTYGVSITTLDEVFLLVARGGKAGDKEEYQSSARVDGSATAAGDDAEKSARSRMDLEKEGLFGTHVGCLFRKRAAYFRRDKKAWCCTTILPSLFVLFGFIIFKLQEGDNNYASLDLNIADFNPEVSSGPRNPVVFNQPQGAYTCQPGRCAYQEPITSIPETGEKYFFCGSQGSIGSDESCSIDDSANMINFIGDVTDEDLATPEPANVSNILESSVWLDLSRSQYPASQYGAVFYSHESGSVLSTNDTTLYSEAAQEACNSNPGDYTDSCERFGGVGYTIAYNYTSLHVSPLFQGLADEALVRNYLDSDDFSASVTIDPMPITKVESGFGAAEDATATWLLVVLSFPFIGGAYASFVVSERESKAKHLQTVAGVKPTAYWFSTFLWDTLNYQFPCWITIALMYAFDITVLTTSNRNANSGVIVVLLLYGPAAASFSYCVSFMFKSPALCSLFVIVFGFLVAMGGPLTIFILTILGNDDPDNKKDNLITAAEVITWILRFFPPFCLGQGLFNVINIDAFEYLEGDDDLNAWSETILLLEVLFLLGESVLYLLLAVRLDIWSNNPRAVGIWQNFVSILTCKCFCKKKDEVDITTALPDDDDVLAEQDRVLAGEANNDLIVLSQMTKVYGNNKIAVNNMSLGIAPGECFGLLGINGAGKTTTMGMLTAEFPPTSGDATLAGFSVTTEPEKTRRRVGYCPQFDAHFANLTGREHVELYAAIKGIPKEFIEEASREMLSKVGLSDEDCDRLAAGYSGGMKRRLSLACAMIGSPQIVFLDECSTGVDPVARREIWQLVSDLVSNGNVPEEERTSVILTTHSMEECEALCPRIGIMANGRLRCLGSAQHLKSKFGQGYQVELKVKLVDRDDEDYKKIAFDLLAFKGVQGEDSDEAGVGLDGAEDIFFNLDEVKTALHSIAGESDFLAALCTENDPIGYNIWKNATAGKQPLDELAVFCASELRMRKVDQFVNETYPNSMLRERQDNKARYEVSSVDVRISNIFGSIESNKADLLLSDYGVSQTSLEQVFNMHAAEAEKLKQGRNDG